MRLHLAAALFLGLAIFSAPAGAQTMTQEPKPSPEVQRLLDEGAASRKTVQERLSIFENGLKVAVERQDRVGEGQALNWIGRCYGYLGKPVKALDLYERALSILKEVRDRSTEAEILSNSGVIYAGLGQPGKALEYFERALPIHREVGERVGEATTLGNIGFVYSSLGKSAQALNSYEIALGLFKGLGDRRSEALTLCNIGFEHMKLGESAMALKYFERARPILQEVGDRRAESQTLINIGFALSNLRKLVQALDFFDHALPILREEGDRQLEATTLRYIGDTYQSLGQPIRALEYLEQARSLQVKEADRHGEGETLLSIGTVYEGVGQLPKARELFKMSLQIARGTNDRRMEAAALNNIGTVCKNLGQLTDAVKNLEQALALRRVVKDRGGEANTLNNLGSLYYDLGQPSKALAYCEDSIRTFREVGDRNGETEALHNLGSIYDFLGQPAKARECHELALPILRQFGNRRGEAYTLCSIGSIHQDLFEFQKALVCYRSAHVIFQETGDRAGEANALYRIGTIADLDFDEKIPPEQYLSYALLAYKEVGDRNGEAVTLLSLADKAFEPVAESFLAKLSANASQGVRMNARGLAGDLRGRLSRKKEEVFRFLAPLLLSRGRDAEALQALDLLKAQERAEADRAAWSGNMPLTPKEAEWDAQIQAVGKPLAEAGAREQALRLRNDLAGAKALEPELERLRTAYSGAIRRVMEDSKKGSDRLESTPASERIKRVTPKGTAAVYALYREDVLHLLVATNGGLQRFKTSVKDLGKRVTTFRQVLEDPTRDPRPSGLAIYKVLAAPIEAHLKAQGVKTVLWSLDGTLRLIPVGALWDGEKFLVERRVHAYFPGSDALRPDDKRTGYRVLACGASKAAPGYAALPGVDAELSAIATAFPGKPLRNGEFTRKALEEGLRAKPTVLHLASHFSLRPGPPENSQLLLGDGTKMSLQEMESLPNSLFASLRLVVLSACETAPGAEDSDGYATEGMAERLLRKGVGAVAASLWPVADQPTAELMRRMYAKLAANPKTSPLAALRSVQLEFLSGRQIVSVPAGVRRSDTKAKRAASAAPKWPTGLPRYAHPYYWAPFVLTGNSR